MDMVFANGTMYVSAVSNSSCPEVTFPVKRLQKANDLVPVLCLPVTLGARALFTCDACVRALFTCLTLGARALFTCLTLSARALFTCLTLGVRVVLPVLTLGVRVVLPV